MVVLIFNSFLDKQILSSQLLWKSISKIANAVLMFHLCCRKYIYFRFGPQATVHDILRVAGGENLAGYRSPLELMEPHLRFPPRFNIDMHWKLQIL